MENLSLKKKNIELLFFPLSLAMLSYTYQNDPPPAIFNYLAYILYVYCTVNIFFCHNFLFVVQIKKVIKIGYFMDIRSNTISDKCWFLSDFFVLYFEVNNFTKSSLVWYFLQRYLKCFLPQTWNLRFFFTYNVYFIVKWFIQPINTIKTCHSFLKSKHILVLHNKKECVPCQ